MTSLNPDKFCCASKPFLCRTCSSKLFGNPESAPSTGAVRRVASAHSDDDIPNGYRAAMDAAPRRPDPSMDPNYKPHGAPPDGYRIALALRRQEQERQR